MSNVKGAYYYCIDHIRFCLLIHDYNIYTIFGIILSQKWNVISWQRKKRNCNWRYIIIHLPCCSIQRTMTNVSFWWLLASCICHSCQKNKFQSQRYALIFYCFWIIARREKGSVNHAKLFDIFDKLQIDFFNQLFNFEMPLYDWVQATSWTNLNFIY